MRVTLSMIVRDEEAVLARCLDSAEGLADEIVIVDTGSCDGTPEIARKYTEHVYFEPWKDDFAHARNVSFAHATGDYVLWLDADDVIPPSGKRDFADLRRLLGQGYDTVMCPYETGGLRYERERVVKRTNEAKWRGHVHECIPPFGKIAHAAFTVVHRPVKEKNGARNLEIYRKWAESERLSGRDLFYYGRELFYHKLYTEAVAILEKMLAGEGWYVHKIEACKTLSACHSALGDGGKALSALFESFRYGEPRASVLCGIGAIFKEAGKYREAAYWYEAALSARDHTEEGDFEEPDCRTVIPTLELVWLYHVLGEPLKSLEYHEKSEAIAPDHPSVLFNRKFFGK